MTLWFNVHKLFVTLIKNKAICKETIIVTCFVLLQYRTQPPVQIWVVVLGSMQTLLGVHSPRFKSLM